MAHIILRVPAPNGDRAQLVINGVDISLDVFADIELVKVGDDKYPETQEVGLRVTYAVSSLELNGADTTVTDQFDKVALAVAQKVTSALPRPRRWWQRWAA